MKVEVAATERTLLGFFLAKVHKIDPDVIVVSRCLIMLLHLSFTFYWRAPNNLFRVKSPCRLVGVAVLPVTRKGKNPSPLQDNFFCNVKATLELLFKFSVLHLLPLSSTHVK
jgi:hypothetical protein